MSEKGIAWPGEAKKYADQPDYNLSEIVPPPNWRARYPDGYTESNPPPNLKENEHFQNWMRTAGLPTFTKLYSRNDQDTLLKGRYQIVVDMSKSLEVDSSSRYIHARFRFPCEIVQGYQIRCHLNSFLDWWKEPFPWLGLRCRCRCLRTLSSAGDHQASRPTEVCPSANSFSGHPTHGSRSTGAWETCRCCRGTDKRVWNPHSVYHISLYNACSRPYGSILRMIMIYL